jgi:hypothetical protein
MVTWPMVTLVLVIVSGIVLWRFIDKCVDC